MTAFPPLVPPVTQTVPSYLYCQYNDDDNLQAFVDAFNTQMQQIINWFTTVGLPVYTGVPIAGPLLDWVAAGLYGFERPILSSGITTYEGDFNSYGMNVLGFNQPLVNYPPVHAPATDDVFKRIITWNFYKGDGRTFNIRWLKRRIMRFLYGFNGTDPGVDQTYRVSVAFGVGNQVNITVEEGRRTITSSSVFNGGGFNTFASNDVRSTYVSYPPIPMAQTFKSAIAAGVIQLPFQFTYVVTV